MKKSIIISFLAAAAMIALLLLFFEEKNSQKRGLKIINKNMEITSSAFQNNGFIPKKYTCDGENINPPLQFNNVPQSAVSLALIVDDPDAPNGTWVHWLVWNINPKDKIIKEGAYLDDWMEGITSFGKNGYGGPCPPSGTHRYFFKLYALDKKVSLGENSGKEELIKEMQGHILAKAELVGLYSRQNK